MKVNSKEKKDVKHGDEIYFEKMLSMVMRFILTFLKRFAKR
jgi:hypothetical protein